ncbi:putative membrane protein [Neobacillus niacini]|uniref:DUF2207 domain-containing protein n=1 Tax=Neobacillus niacini TaxID=86668 RepID=UPI002863F781|nr:DUF2207 domain-containing protein [Neobacillus niacini]MDR7080703.1 putative membrane protein [Neobacillus niacini]
MLKKWFTSLLFLALLFIFPLQSLAVEYSITNVNMDAYLQDNGDVKVEETHTYEFDGDFNGITREIIPKEGAAISQFTATEQGESLRVEKEDDLYKVHRKGADETITVTLHYTIENGMEIYQDAAQFYWPFFDDRNESSYENLTITIHPPNPTDDVIAFGYDAANNTETIQEDGSVLFQLGYVPDGTNGDIRVAYPSSLFPAAPKTAVKPMKEEILKAQQELIDQAEADEATRDTLSTISTIGIPAFIIILLLLMGRDWLTSRAKTNDFLREGTKFHNVPKQIMSLPATIFFTNNGYLPPQAMAAGLLDLVRQGYVKKASIDSFQLINAKSPLKHETVLMKWLFDKIGSKNTFSFDDLTAFSKNKLNHDRYRLFQAEWLQAVKQEVVDRSLYENKKVYRLLVGFSSVLLLPFLFLFPIYDLLGTFFAALLLFFTVVIYAIVYRPKNWEGAKIAYEWKQFKTRFKETTQDEWEIWSEDDQMRAYIYGLGISSKEIDRKYDALIEALTSDNDYYDDTVGFYAIAFIGPDTSAKFRSANDSASSSTSGGSSSSGGGTSGGGGGSGAF